MTEPLTPDDLTAIRALHYDTEGWCNNCAQPYPCLVVRLLDEVERLRAFEATIRRITGLPTDDELIHGSGPEPLGILNAERIQ